MIRSKSHELMFKAEAQNCALVKCIADNAISWIYAPLTRGHSLPEGHDHEVGGEMTQAEVAEDRAVGVEVGGDEIVIDEEMDESPGLSLKGADHQNQEGMAVKMSDEDTRGSDMESQAPYEGRGEQTFLCRCSKTYRGGSERYEPKTMSEQGLGEYADLNPHTSDSSQCRTPPPAEEGTMNAEADEVVPDLERTDRSTARSPNIQDPEQHSSTPYLDKMKRMISQLEFEGHSFDIEIITHKIAGWLEQSMTRKLHFRSAPD